MNILSIRSNLIQLFAQARCEQFNEIYRSFIGVSINKPITDKENEKKIESNFRSSILFSK